MKIYTKTGDDGKTSLLGGTRVLKSHNRIEAFGTVDELNAYIGLVKDQPVNQNRTAPLYEIQNKLFVIGAILSTDPDKKNVKIPALDMEDIQMLENQIDAMNETLPALKFFILPGGHPSVSFAHIARCICRRAERLVVLLSQSEPVEKLVMIYLNRLSDYLFVLARMMSQDAGVNETVWHPTN